MSDILFGESTFKANILENLTTGMYHDSKVIYREYIQNACDSIDKAVNEGMFQSIEEGSIEIWIDTEKRSIMIEDNGLGLSADDFVEMLTTIGGSQKQFGENKGFRGMGRLCGIGYCTTLLFTSSAAGEPTESILACDAVTMRRMLNEHNTHEKDYTAIEVLRTTTSITTHPTEKTDSHFFRVELLGISSSNTDLLDKEQVQEYLSFVAPVPYKNTFVHRHMIYKHAKALGVSIDEYNIQFEDKTIYKNYKPSVFTSKGEDAVSDVDFYDFKDDHGNLIAWLWYGVTRFQAVIKKECKERGIRLRKENIQIGNEDALQKLFKEDRGQHYFIGEVFAVDKNLIPNSQRSYFNENDARTEFESMLRLFFNATLSKIYKDGSTVNAAVADINRSNKLGEQISEAQRKGIEIDPKLCEQYDSARQKAERKKKELTKITEQVNQKITSGDFQPVDIVIHNIIDQITPPTLGAPIHFPPKTKTASQTQKRAGKTISSKSAKAQRMVPFEKVEEIIRRTVDSEIANLLIAKIEEDMI